MCHYGNAWCANQSDDAHECPPKPAAARRTTFGERTMGLILAGPPPKPPRRLTPPPAAPTAVLSAQLADLFGALEMLFQKREQRATAHAAVGEAEATRDDATIAAAHTVLKHFRDQYEEAVAGYHMELYHQFAAMLAVKER